MATNTYVALDKVTVSGTSIATVTFSSIPSTYTDLIIVGNLGSEGTNAFPYLQFNGDTGSNYSYTQLYGTGTSTGTGRTSNSTQLFNNDVSVKQGAVNSNVVYQIMNYSNSTTHKTSLVRQSTLDAADYNGSLAAVGTWRNTAAITSVAIKLTRGGTGYNFSNGSTFSLYGIKAWSDETTPKATGGYVYSDSTYWYHAFPFSSTFTPNQSLTADILCVAGGGGGGGWNGGGGGAGGLQAFSSQSLTATNYTVTIGSGGAGGTSSASSNGLAGTNGSNSVFGALTASVGGGGGGGHTSSGPGSGLNGGSGGGRADRSGGVVGTATSGQGYAGGNSVDNADNTDGAGGGGGAGAVGANGVDYFGGAGGIGATSAFINSIGAVTTFAQSASGNYYFAGGGGGGAGSDTTSAGTGGIGGGGAGTKAAVGINATVSTGGGGGGAGGSTGGYTGGSGGSGIVVVRYAK